MSQMNLRHTMNITKSQGGCYMTMMMTYQLMLNQPVDLIFLVFRFPAGRRSLPLQSAPPGPQTHVASGPLSVSFASNSTSSPSPRLRNPGIWMTVCVRTRRQLFACYYNASLGKLYWIENILYDNENSLHTGMLIYFRNAINILWNQ